MKAQEKETINNTTAFGANKDQGKFTVFFKSGRGGKRGKQRSNPFREELRKLMYGFGDA